MLKKLLFFIFFLSLYQLSNAQNEFITIWKPGSSQQIKFPGRGTNFNVYWEEIGYTQHNGIINNVTSVTEFIINFGTSLNPVPTNATYRVKISNGNGAFTQIRFFDNTLIPIYNNTDYIKLLDVSQWGNIQWQSFEDAFVLCTNLNVTATDIPNLNSVTSLRQMFYICGSMVGNPSFSTWNTSSVTTMYNMFADAENFNQPIGNWNVSNVTDMYGVFDNSRKFNQSLENWNTSNVTKMDHMFHGAVAFNQDISSWDTSNVIDMEEMFHSATSFNQNIGNWNLSALTNAKDMFLDSGLNCQNYDHIIFGWNMNTVTPNGINMGSASPLIYSNPLAVNARNNLITNKTWTITGDAYNGECQSFLSTSDVLVHNEISIYPNPATDFIYIKNAKGFDNYKIFDMSGRIVLQSSLHDDKINISSLTKGNYILQIISKNKTETLKFIKK
ncbi:BspA family leucine-rich repeat surface protein [Chryseobacterium paridis]|uniref:BspA family leucine-rich repeat surface protein n=1 Tax=Chryseobacterium paridis TaxID=2800328 RepID=A0ABS1FYN5_9FLAO|nr:BspA family leucine-rich repeat surface protein [Chryseobacterium paridis]MBK1897448.1 BspA family leucine-rich repeat surface protein [Chryseobacterium paridis]